MRLNGSPFKHSAVLNVVQCDVGKGSAFPQINMRAFAVETAHYALLLHCRKQKFELMNASVCPCELEIHIGLDRHVQKHDMSANKMTRTRNSQYNMQALVIRASSIFFGEKCMRVHFPN